MIDTHKWALNMIGIFLSVVFFTEAHALKPKTTPKATSTNTKRVYWDHWYKMTISQRIPYAVYHEVVDEEGGKIRFAVNMKKLEDGFFNEENMGAFSTSGPELAPLFYNFRSMFRTTETIIDGTFSEPTVLSVKVRKNNQEQPVIRKQIPKGTMFSTFFPLWLHRKSASMKPLQSVSFRTFLEDKLDLGFKLESGVVRLDPQDDLAKKTDTQKFAVSYLGNRSIWYVKSSGAALRIEIPLQNLSVDMTTEAEAAQFLQK